MANGFRKEKEKKGWWKKLEEIREIMSSHVADIVVVLRHKESCEYVKTHGERRTASLKRGGEFCGVRRAPSRGFLGGRDEKRLRAKGDDGVRRLRGLAPRFTMRPDLSPSNTILQLVSSFPLPLLRNRKFA